MLEKLIQTYLKWTGKGYLVPFINGLANLGRPSTVFFPMELMEQGMAIILSGLNNTMAIQSNLDWIWPLWVERQMDPAGEEFIPTAINLIKTNLTCRNWTSVGLGNSPREAMVDPVGMLTLRPYGWSVFPYVRLEGRSFFPPRLMPRLQALQSLLDGSLPCVITQYEVRPNLGWKSEIMAVEVNGEDCISFSHTLVNRSNSHLSLKFGLAIRPYNPLTVGHINSIQYHEGLWRINGHDGLYLYDTPDHTILSDRHHGDPLVKDVLIGGRRQLKSRSGIACGQAEYHLELGPGQARTLEVLGFMGNKLLKSLKKGPEKASLKNLIEIKNSRVNALIQDQESGLRICIPDEKMLEAFQAVKSHIHVFDDNTHFSPGTFLFHNHWFRDSAFIALAFENMGWGERVAPKILNYPKHQTDDGFFKSQHGEWDSNGEAMWTIVNHIKRGGNPTLLKRLYPALIKGARWIAKMRDETRVSPSPHFGLMPSGFSAEHFGPNDHYYWDNLWSLAGLEAAKWAAEKLGHANDVLWLQDLLLDYRGDLAASMDWAWKKSGRKALPCSPYRSLDSAAIGNLVGLSPLNVIDIDETWIRGTLDFLLENNLRDGLFFQRIVHTGLNPYLSAQLARTMMALGDPRWIGILESLLQRASPTYTWPEAIHPRMYGGCMGDGDHGWSAAEFLNLIRDMLVTERSGSLLLAEAAPTKWFKPGLRLEVFAASTIHGIVNYCLLQGSVSATLSWRITRSAFQDPAPLYFHLPASSGLNPGISYTEVAGIFKIPLPTDSGELTFFASRIRGGGSAQPPNLLNAAESSVNQSQRTRNA